MEAPPLVAGGTVLIDDCLGGGLSFVAWRISAVHGETLLVAPSIDSKSVAGALSLAWLSQQPEPKIADLVVSELYDPILNLGLYQGRAGSESLVSQREASKHFPSDPVQNVATRRVEWGCTA